MMVLRRCIREGEMFRENAGSAVGLQVAGRGSQLVARLSALFFPGPVVLWKQ
jgi:hypothetical protein